jgi:hypothetical protein
MGDPRFEREDEGLLGFPRLTDMPWLRKVLERLIFLDTTGATDGAMEVLAGADTAGQRHTEVERMRWSFNRKRGTFIFIFL